jgi:hypothetical protein
MHLCFVRTFLLSVASLLLVSISFNLAVDPFSTNCWFNIRGFNANKPEQGSRMRLMKTFEVYRGKPAAISMGSSRTNYGLKIANAHWGSDPIYNLGLSGAGVDEIQHFLSHAMAQGRLKKAIIGLDFFMFNADYVQQHVKDFDDSILSYPGDPNPYREGVSMLSIAMSRDTLAASLATFFNNLPGLANDRNLPPSNLPANQRHEILYELADYLDIVYFPKETGRFTFYNQPRGNMFEYVRKIIRFCYQHNIETKFFISPIHAWQLEGIDAAGLWPKFEYWKKNLAAIMEDEATQHNSPAFQLWDFTGYNSVTTEAVPPCNSHEIMEGYLEAAHYKPAVGRLVLERALGQDDEDVPDDFGVLITALNMDNHLEMIRQDRVHWRLNHRSDYDEIRLLAARVFGKKNPTYDFICRKIPSK